VTCGIPGHDRAGEELRAEILRVDDPPLRYEVYARCGYTSDFDYWPVANCASRGKTPDERVTAAVISTQVLLSPSASRAQGHVRRKLLLDESRRPFERSRDGVVPDSLQVWIAPLRS
jgi:hypothetical protein